MKVFFVAGISACCCLAGLATASMRYSFSSAGNYPGAFYSVPIGVNSTQIVGYYVTLKTGPAYVETFHEDSLQTPSSFSTIAPPGSGTSYASGINSHGAVAGGYCLTGCTYPQSQHGFTWDNGIFTTIDCPGAMSTGAYGINDHGQVVGGFCSVNTVCAGYVVNPTQHAFLDDHGTFTELDYPGPSIAGTQANAINNAGQIVGTYSSLTGLHSFLYQNGVYTTIDDPNAVWTSATTINNHGVVAGFYQDGQLNVHGFIYQNGQFTTVDHPDTGGTGISGINDGGIIVGTWNPPKGGFANFIGIPAGQLAR
jgi:probable HAF family extracellular repeat protein